MKKISFPTYLVPAAIILVGVFLVVSFEMVIGSFHFWTEHADAIAVMIGFGVTIAVSIALTIRHGDIAEQRAKMYHDITLRETRRNIAAFLWKYRRAHREVYRWGADQHKMLYGKTREIEQRLDNMFSELQGAVETTRQRTFIIQGIQIALGEMRENQRDIRDHFHSRLEPIERKFQLAGIKAAAKLMLKGEDITDSSYEAKLPYERAHDKDKKDS